MMEYGPPPLFRQGVPARVRFILFVLAALVMILVDGRLRALDSFRSTVVSFTAPLTELIALPGQMLGQGAGYFVSKKTLKAENDRLSEENQLLQLKAARYEELELENTRLRALVEAVPRSGSRVVTGEVLGRVADSFTRRIQINLGESAGIQVGMPVIGAMGALGQVSRVVAHLSEITLVTDHNQQISVMNERTGERYIASGTGEELLDVLFVAPGADVEPGDRLVTTGLDRLFPPNITVGTVRDTAYQPGETYKRVSATPSVDLSDLRFATVILVDPNPTAALEKPEETTIRRRAPR